MSEILTYMNIEGELESIVRGYSGESSGGFSPSFCLPVETASFYEPEMETTALDELGELYKPFYPFSTTQTTLTSSSYVHEDSISFQDDVKKQRPHDHHVRISESKTKKSKKNQQKRVIEQVKEENLLMDAWAWRKYGQKPIKGSPYPRLLNHYRFNFIFLLTKDNRLLLKIFLFIYYFRSYYRCSSLKGCLARKQVERNPQNPEKFTITYTNEHNHELPTRRNSLAGSTRAKSTQTKPSLTKKLGKEVVSSPTSNPMITSADESPGENQDKGVAEMSNYQIVGKPEGVSSNLPSDLMSGSAIFPSFTGDFDELLSSQEFFNEYLWNN
ncbi:unnamed protein product [Cochlearia groenlandica]